MGILTIDEYKTATGVTGTAQDPKIVQGISWVEAVILNYTDRDFGAPAAIATRTYPYQSTRYTEIDDCSLITAVTLGGHTLTSAEYVAGPVNGPVFYWLELFYQLGGPSPEMGFTYNLDKYWPWITPQLTMGVTATFGYPVVPGDVKLAAVEILRGFVGGEDSGGGEKQSEAIDSYAISWQQTPQDAASSSALPRKAVDLLDQYRRINL